MVGGRDKGRRFKGNEKIRRKAVRMKNVMSKYEGFSLKEQCKGKRINVLIVYLERQVIALILSLSRVFMRY